jgi:hypothetical protein
MIGLALVLLLQAGQWTSIPPLAIARQEAGVAAAEGRVYVIGGIGTDQQGSTAVEIFETRTGRPSKRSLQAKVNPVVRDEILSKGKVVYRAAA